ncbi:MAG: sensor histidine kinase, partial [Acetobacteraceae bacterium]
MTAGGRRSPPTGLGLAAASIVHDANNRLTAIIATAETALRRPGLDAEIAAELRHIRQEAHRAAAMLRGLLAPGARTAATSRRYLRLDPIVQAISASLRRLLGPRARLDLTLGCGTESVWLDPDALHDALLNLAANARDAMAEDGVLTLQTTLVDVASPLPGVPQSIPPGRYAVIEVGDNGGGMPPQVMQRLCEPFFTT